MGLNRPVLRRRSTPAAVLAGLATFALAACTATEPRSTGRLPVAFSMGLPTANATSIAKRVDLVISGPGINPDILATFLFDTTGTASGQLEVPIGSPRVLSLKIYDANNVLLLAGIDTISVTAGVNPPAQVKVTPSTGTQPITVTIGSFSLTVSPGSATITAPATQQFSAVVKDASGATVTTPVSWGSSNPAIATVSATGLVTGVIPGTVTITATAQGIAAAVTVTVQ